MQIEKGKQFIDKMTGNKVEVIEITEITVRYKDLKTGFTYLLVKDAFAERVKEI